MANEQNLIQNKETTPTERRENARKAGKASAESRKQKAKVREYLLECFHCAEVGKNPETGEPIIGAEYVASKIVAGVKKGNYKMLMLYLEMVGEKPSDKVELSGSFNVNNELKGILEQLGGGDDDGED